MVSSAGDLCPYVKISAVDGPGVRVDMREVGGNGWMVLCDNGGSGWIMLSSIMNCPPVLQGAAAPGLERTIMKVISVVSSCNF